MAGHADISPLDTNERGAPKHSTNLVNAERSTEPPDDTNKSGHSSSNSMQEDGSDIDLGTEDLNANRNDESTTNAIDETWRSLLNDPNKTYKTTEFIPYLESYSNQNHELRQEMQTLKHKLRQSKATHRGSIVALHNKMFKKLLDAEEEHESHVESGMRKIANLERKIEVYELLDRDEEVSTILQEFLAKEQKFVDQLEELQALNKQLENELKIERMKSNDDVDRRQSVTTLHNRMFQKLLDVEENSEEKIVKLETRVKELENELVLARNSKGSGNQSVQSSALASAKIDEQMFENYVQQIKDLKQNIKYLELENSTLKEQKQQAYYNAERGDPVDVEREMHQWKTMYNDTKKELESLQKELKKNKIGDSIKEEIENYKRQYEEEKKKRETAQTEVRQRQEVLTKWLEIGDHDVLQLKAYIGKLEKQLSDESNKAQTSEKGRRESIVYLTTQMMTSLVEAETEHDKELKDMTSTIDRLEEEKKSLSVQLHAEERKRKNSNAEVSASMFQKLLLLEQEKEEAKNQYERRINQLEQQLEETQAGAPRRASEVHSSMFKSLLEAEADYNNAKTEWENKENELKNEIKLLNEELTKIKQIVHKTDKQRRESVSQLQDDMWKHLVEVDEDNRKEKKQLQNDVKNYREEVLMLRKRVVYLENSKLAIIEECNRQMNLMRTGIQAMNELHK